MATALTSITRPVAQRTGAAAVRATHWHRLVGAIHRRAGRIEGIVVVVAMLLPQLIITLLGN
jgi:hypothetical protein